MTWQRQRLPHKEQGRNTLKRAARAQSEIPKGAVTALDQNPDTERVKWTLERGKDQRDYLYPQIWGKLALQVLLKLLNKAQSQS